MSARWIKDSVGRRTFGDWSDWLYNKDKLVDPYLIWADVAGGAGFAAKDQVDEEAQHRWPFIIELATEGLSVFYDDLLPHTDVPVVFGCIQIPGVYKIQSLDDPHRWTIDGKYVTALVHPEDLWHVMHSETIVRAQLGLPRIPSANEVPVDRPSSPGGAEGQRVVIGVIDDGFGFAHERLLDSKGQSRVRYLWDQDARRESPSWRKLGWKEPKHLGYGGELGPDDIDKAVELTGDQWSAYRAAGYGRYRLDPETHSTAPVNAEMLGIPVESMVASSHGHSVLDLAAGFPPRHPGQTTLTPAALGLGPRSENEARNVVDGAIAKAIAQGSNRTVREHEQVQLDSADRWPIICVQLPVRTVADTSGGSLAVHVLDGIRYIVERARRIPYLKDSSDVTPRHDNNVVVINLSYGATAGGHDGSSILEKAIPDFVKRQSSHPVWVVLAAGNAAKNAAHSSVEMRPGCEPRVLSWQVGPDNPLESYLEIWLPDRDVWGRRVLPESVQSIRVDLCTPGGERVLEVKAGEVWQLREDVHGIKGAPLAAVVYPHRVVQSQHGTMILIATAPTRRSSEHPLAPHGEWTVILSWNPGSQATGPRILVHAWSERSDLLFETARGQQSRVFSDEPTRELSQFDPSEIANWNDSQRTGLEVEGLGLGWPRYTLSSVASALPVAPGRTHFADREGHNFGEVVVVGAHRQSDSEVAGISSGGPSRLASYKDRWTQIMSRGNAPPADPSMRMAPDVTAPGDISPALPGLRVSGLRSGLTARISETSAAAAMVTRAIANVQFVQIRDGGAPRADIDAAIGILFDGPPHSGENDNARNTLTPRADDGFRAGKTRLR